jgi:hypothetical protein
LPVKHFEEVEVLEVLNSRRSGQRKNYSLIILISNQKLFCMCFWWSTWAAIANKVKEELYPLSQLSRSWKHSFLELCFLLKSKALNSLPCYFATIWSLLSQSCTHSEPLLIMYKHSFSVGGTQCFVNRDLIQVGDKFFKTLHSCCVVVFVPIKIWIVSMPPSLEILQRV